MGTKNGNASRGSVQRLRSNINGVPRRFAALVRPVWPWVALLLPAPGPVHPTGGIVPTALDTGRAAGAKLNLIVRFQRARR